MLKQNWTVRNLPATFFTDLFGVLEKILLGIWMSTQYKPLTPEQLSVRIIYLRVLYEVLVQDPTRINHLNLSEEQQVEALGLTTLIQSGEDDQVSLGVNMVQLLMHHGDGVTLAGLVKFDITTRDIIHKRESVKVWDAINQLGDQVVNSPDPATLQRIKTLIVPEIDERIETEIEHFDTKVSKRMTAFFQVKINEINKKLESQGASLKEQSDHLKTMEGNFSQERSIVQRQVKDLSEGKAISETDLKEIANI